VGALYPGWEEKRLWKESRAWAWAVFVVALLLTSCIDKDAGDIDPSLVYDAEFSIPLGDSLLQAYQFVDTTALVPLPDTADMDTVEWFLYDGVFYYSPGVLIHRSETPLSLSDFITDTSEIVSLTFRINAVNRVPARMRLQLYFTDAGRQVLDSLFSDGPLQLEAAAVDGRGEVTAPAELWKKDVVFSPSQIALLEQMEYALQEYTLVLPVSADDSIPFYSDQEVWLQMGVRVGVKIVLQ
jgi:hypothetical protein